MEEKNIIICSNCYEENAYGTKTCRKCGAKIYYNDEKMLKEITEDKKNTFNKHQESEAQYIDSSNSFNNGIKNNGISIALKVIGIIGIIAGLITGFILFEDEFFIGLTILISSVITGTLILGVGEIIQKLENIENNIKKEV